MIYYFGCDRDGGAGNTDGTRHVSTSGADGHGYALYTHGFLLIIQCISLTAVCGKCLHQLVVVGDGVLCDGRQAMLANDGFHLFGGHLTEHGLPAAGTVHGECFAGDGV